jgi:hypothetical protein
VMSATFINRLPTLPMFGFFPTIQTIVAQAILILLAAAAAIVPMARKRSATSAVPGHSSTPQASQRVG